ncbi:MAG TPA: cupin domain-containing protein [Clostridia bacterium]|nr:cupin domain-containing protein [Clostridia bacterium]
MEAVIRNQRDAVLEKRPNHREVYGKQLTVNAENGRLSANLITIKPEGEIIPHTHEVLEVIYIIEGEASVLVNGARQKGEAGTILVAPAGSEHGILNTGDKDVIMYCVFSPAIA